VSVHEEFRSILRRAGIRRQRPVVCVLAVRVDDQDGPLVLMQLRQKIFDDTPFKGYWEMPQGRVDRNETISEATKRELQEETGLVVRRFLKGGESLYSYGDPHKSALTYSYPLTCVVDSVSNFFAVCVVVETEGDPQKTPEARNHRWCDPPTIRSMIESGKVFPLNVPMLTDFLDRHPIDNGY
jgi:8-oxo-dGTP pyrophosphatase MutT (NUDIX family)